MLKHFSTACKFCVISITTRLSVCLSVCSHISKTTCPNLTKLTVPVAHVRGSGMTMTTMQLETYFRFWTTFPSKPLSQKTQKLLPITSANVNRFSQFFHWQTQWYTCNKSRSNVATHLSYVATLPCEIFIFKKLLWSRSYWSKLPCKTSPFKKNSFKIFVC